MGGKSDAPPPPDYSPIANADAESAQKAFQLGEDQLAWSKQQFNTTWPYAQSYLQQQISSSAEETANAQKYADFYEKTYKPIESQFAKEAIDYNSPARADANAARAMANVATASNIARTAALSNLESYGIDPSETRYGALDLGTRISQAAATAGAGTQSRLNTEATGLALQGEAINTGRGYASNVANAYSTAADAGKSGLAGANSTTAVAGETMGNPTSYFGLGNQALSNQGNLVTNAYNSQVQGYNAQLGAQSNTLSGIGQLVGGALVLGGV